jgi:hypothetical protein
MLLNPFIFCKIAGYRRLAGYVLNSFCCENPKNYEPIGEISVFQHDGDSLLLGCFAAYVGS